MNAPEPACLAIADISGYTDYLAGVELDHAQDILADLVDTVVGSLRPTLRLAKLEGDAAFVYVVAETVDGSLLQDVVERTYVAFRKRLRDISLASRCACNACIRIPHLDLKVVVHHGIVVQQRVAGREELVGREVILVHRLLKTTIAESTGISAYAAYTVAAVEAMGIADPAAQGLVEAREAVDVIGDVGLWVRDLDAVWRADQERAGAEVGAADAYEVFRYASPLPPALTWEYMTSPIHRPQWGGMDELREMTTSGRRGVGTVNHCVHGRDTLIEEILEWRPYVSVTTRLTLPLPGAPKLVQTEVLTPDGADGSIVELRIGRPKPRQRAAFEQLFAAVRPNYVAATEGLRAMLVDIAAERNGASTDEPQVPPSARRFATEPVVLPAGTVDSSPTRSSLG